MKKLDDATRGSWDALIKTEGKALGLEDCRPFLENKVVNDIFYAGTFKGEPCVVKCSSRAPDSIANEYEMSRRLAEADPDVCAPALALWRAPDGRRAFVVTGRLPGPSLTEIVAKGADADEAIGVMEDMLRIASALQKAGIVWRDIIPDNFLCGADGHLRLIDAQFAIDRNDFRESEFLMRRWTYRMLLFAHHPDMAGRGWNDVAMMLHFTRLLPDGDEVRALRERLRAMSSAAAFPVDYGFADDVRMAFHLAELWLRAPFASKKKKVVLRDRAARAVRFLKRSAKW